MKDERSEDDLCVSILSFLFYLISLKHFLSMYYSLTQCGSQTLIPGTRSTSTTLELVEMQILRLGLGISIRNWGWAYQFWYCKSSLWHWYRLKFLPRTPTVWEQTFQHVSQVQGHKTPYDGQWTALLSLSTFSFAQTSGWNEMFKKKRETSFIHNTFS